MGSRAHLTELQQRRLKALRLGVQTINVTEEQRQLALLGLDPRLALLGASSAQNASGAGGRPRFPNSLRRSRAVATARAKQYNSWQLPRILQRLLFGALGNSTASPAADGAAAGGENAEGEGADDDGVVDDDYDDEWMTSGSESEEGASVDSDSGMSAATAAGAAGTSTTAHPNLDGTTAAAGPAAVEGAATAPRLGTAVGTQGRRRRRGVRQKLISQLQLVIALRPQQSLHQLEVHQCEILRELPLELRRVFAAQLRARDDGGLMVPGAVVELPISVPAGVRAAWRELYEVTEEKVKLEACAKSIVLTVGSLVLHWVRWRGAGADGDGDGDEGLGPAGAGPGGGSGGGGPAGQSYGVLPHDAASRLRALKIHVGRVLCCQCEEAGAVFNLLLSRELEELARRCLRMVVQHTALIVAAEPSPCSDAMFQRVATLYAQSNLLLGRLPSLHFMNAAILRGLASSEYRARVLPYAQQPQQPQPAKQGGQQRPWRQNPNTIPPQQLPHLPPSRLRELAQHCLQLQWLAAERRRLEQVLREHVWKLRPSPRRAREEAAQPGREAACGSGRGNGEGLCSQDQGQGQGQGQRGQEQQGQGQGQAASSTMAAGAGHVHEGGEGGEQHGGGGGGGGTGAGGSKGVASTAAAAAAAAAASEGSRRRLWRGLQMLLYGWGGDLPSDCTMDPEARQAHERWEQLGEVAVPHVLALVAANWQLEGGGCSAASAAASSSGPSGAAAHGEGAAAAAADENSAGAGGSDDVVAAFPREMTDLHYITHFWGSVPLMLPTAVAGRGGGGGGGDGGGRGLEEEGRGGDPFPLRLGRDQRRRAKDGMLPLLCVDEGGVLMALHVAVKEAPSVRMMAWFPMRLDHLIDKLGRPAATAATTPTAATATAATTAAATAATAPATAAAAATLRPLVAAVAPAGPDAAAAVAPAPAPAAAEVAAAPVSKQDGGSRAGPQPQATAGPGGGHGAAAGAGGQVGRAREGAEAGGGKGRPGSREKLAPPSSAPSSSPSSCGLSSAVLFVPLGPFARQLGISRIEKHAPIVVDSYPSMDKLRSSVMARLVSYHHAVLDCCFGTGIAAQAGRAISVIAEVAEHLKESYSRDVACHVRHCPDDLAPYPRRQHARRNASGRIRITVVELVRIDTDIGLVVPHPDCQPTLAD